MAYRRIKNMEIDVGVLGENVWDDMSSVGEHRFGKTGVRDALKHIVPGCSFSSVGGKVGGETATPILPNIPGLHIEEIGNISTPISNDHGNAMKQPNISIYTTNDVFTNVYQIEPQDLQIKNPKWQPSLDSMVASLAFKMGIDPSHLTAELDCLLILGSGSSIDWCSAVGGQRDIGVLLVQVPSSFTGGLLKIYDGEEGGEEQNAELNITNYDLGESSGESEFACHYTFFHKDCQMKIEEILGGFRLLLKYSVRSKHTMCSLPSAVSMKRSIIPLRRSLDSLHGLDRIVLIPLGKRYDSKTLLNKGLDALETQHRAKAEAIKALGTNWRVMIVQAKKFHRSYLERRQPRETSTKTSIEEVFNETGMQVTLNMRWLQDLVSFDSIPPIDPEIGEDMACYSEMSDDTSDPNDFSDVDDPSDPFVDHLDEANKCNKISGSMLLSDSRLIIGSWGERVSRETKKENPEGYPHYGADVFEHISTYVSTFFVAFDQNSEFELKSLVDPSGALTECISPGKDYSLLDRFLSVFEATKHEIDNEECCNLLEILLDSEKSPSFIAPFVIRTLQLSTEPDSRLWDKILIAVKVFGWHTLYGCLASMFCDEQREIPSNMTAYLDRFEFLIKLKTCQSINADIESIDKFIATCISDLRGSKLLSSRYDDDDDIFPKVGRLVLEYECDDAIVRACLSSSCLLGSRYTCDRVCDAITFVYKLQVAKAAAACELTDRKLSDLEKLNTSVVHDQEINKSVAVAKQLSLMARCEMVKSKALTHPVCCTVIRDCFQSLVRKFCSHSGLYYFPESKFGYRIKLLRCIRIAFVYGTQKDLDLLGKEMLCNQTTFSMLLRSAVYEAADSIDSPYSFARDLVSRCLVQHTVPLSNIPRSWVKDGRHYDHLDRNRNADIYLPPSTHIQMVFDIYPDLGNSLDAHGRLPLHWLLNVSGASYETFEFMLEKNPAAATIRDPVSGMYPFMMPGSLGNSAIALNLPDLSHSFDEHGRLPLHWLLSVSEVSDETLEFILKRNPAAATIRDPVSGMYPFMMPGSVCSSEFVFKLLRAGPNLVAGGIPNGVESNKRKRSHSLENSSFTES